MTFRQGDRVDISGCEYEGIGIFLTSRRGEALVDWPGRNLRQRLPIECLHRIRANRVASDADAGRM